MSDLTEGTKELRRKMSEKEPNGGAGFLHRRSESIPLRLGAFKEPPRSRLCHQNPDPPPHPDPDVVIFLNICTGVLN